MGPGRRCISCGKSWAETLDSCPDDGEALREEASPVAPATPDTLVSSSCEGRGRWGLSPLPSIAEALGESDDQVFGPVRDLEPGAVVGDYRVDAKIGEGAMATVYAVTHTFIAKKAAIKVLGAALSNNREAIFRFVQEARVVNRIGHPNIVDIFAFGKLPDGRCYLVMELLRGETLFDRLRHGCPPLAETVEILDQICVALEAVHGSGLVHRDLKPANVFLAPTGGAYPLVKLLDFGLVKLDSTSAAPDLTSSGAVMGTPHYMSPEQGRALSVDARSDLYSLGVITFQLVFGRVPFDADNSIDIAHMHMHAVPPEPREAWPDIPAALERTVRGLLAKNPAERPSLREVRAALAELRPRARALPAFSPGPAFAPEDSISTARVLGGADREPPRAGWRRPWSPGVVAAVAAAAVALFLAVAMGGATAQRRADHRSVAAEVRAIHDRLAARRLIAPAGDSAFDRLVSAQRRFPQDEDLRVLAGSLARTLKEAGIAEVRAGRHDAGRALLDRRAALAAADAETTAAMAEARAASVAMRAGMVRVGDFWIDRYEYPNARGTPPLTRVDWATAVDLCRRGGKRLCTEREWQRACRGATGSEYPYGSIYRPAQCLTAAAGNAPAGSGARPHCVTPEGVADLSGNVAEWTDTPVRAHAPQKVILGGYWAQSGGEVSCGGRDYFLPGNGGASYIGFRCCL